MTTYRAIASTEDDPNAPLTAQLAEAWTGNVLAIAEGDATAPNVEAGAVIGLNASGDINTTGLVITPLGNNSPQVRIRGSILTPMTNTLTVELSNNGGSSYGAAQTINGATLGNGSNPSSYSWEIVLNKETGAYAFHCAGVSGGSAATMADGNRKTGTIAVPGAGVNRIRIKTGSAPTMCFGIAEHIGSNT